MHVSDNHTVLRVIDGSVVLGGRPVLRGVDLAVPAGGVLAVLGANGSGKSTLVRAALGLAPLRSGRVELFGTPLERFRDWRRVGYVPQRATAASGVPASVREVVSAGRLAHRRPLVPLRRADKAAVRRALAAVGLESRARERVATLSGGQQQRVLIARALAGEPELLLLDEPTAGIDLTSQETFASILEQLTSAGTTVVLVAHELGPLAGLIRRAVVMREGRVVYDGPPLDSFRDAEEPHPHLHADPGARAAGAGGPDWDRVDYVPDVAATIDRATGRDTAGPP